MPSIKWNKFLVCAQVILEEVLVSSSTRFKYIYMCIHMCNTAKQCHSLPSSTRANVTIINILHCLHTYTVPTLNHTFRIKSAIICNSLDTINTSFLYKEWFIFGFTPVELGNIKHLFYHFKNKLKYIITTYKTFSCTYVNFVYKY